MDKTMSSTGANGDDSNPEAVCTKLLDEPPKSVSQDQPTTMIVGSDTKAEDDELPESPVSSEDEFGMDNFIPVDNEEDTGEIYNREFHPDVQRFYRTTDFVIEVFDYEERSCDRSKNEAVYMIWLKSDIVSESQCTDVIKEINNCHCAFIRRSKRDPKLFYAKLNNEQAERLKCVNGVHMLYTIYEHITAG